MFIYYKSFYVFFCREAQKLFGSSVDSDQYWALELDKCIERIRRDFECLYASIQRSTQAYYDDKSLEMQIEVEETLKYKKSEQEEFAFGQQALQQEYEQVQASLLQQKEIQAKYEAELGLIEEIELILLIMFYFFVARLEADLQTIQVQHEKKFDEQNQLLTNGQEEILIIGQNIGEVRRRFV